MRRLPHLRPGDGLFDGTRTSRAQGGRKIRRVAAMGILRPCRELILERHDAIS